MDKKELQWKGLMAKLYTEKSFSGIMSNSEIVEFWGEAVSYILFPLWYWLCQNDHFPLTFLSLHHILHFWKWHSQDQSGRIIKTKVKVVISKLYFFLIHPLRRAKLAEDSSRSYEGKRYDRQTCASSILASLPDQEHGDWKRREIGSINDKWLWGCRKREKECRLGQLFFFVFLNLLLIVPVIFWHALALFSSILFSYYRLFSPWNECFKNGKRSA